ncbi:MAG: UvrD-helicase domain-containing protein, partial [Gammaproteobacteria bacterium]|nr:UvrD-helicase domain-containing protein [Gammaproteobacteria bacterium]
GIVPDEAMRKKATNLYETMLYRYRPAKTTTFHAFCQSLLQRFPLESNVPVGFELVETGTALYQEAWTALFNEATHNPDDELAQSLENIFAKCGSISNSRKALLGFLDHSNDWLAFTLGQDNPVSYACEKLTLLLDIEKQEKNYIHDLVKVELTHYAELLKMNTATDVGFGDLILASIDEGLEQATLLTRLTPVFLKANGEPRTRDSKPAQMKRMGASKEEQFLDLHNKLQIIIMEALDYQKRLSNYIFISAWYFAGQRLLELHQRIKREQRILDFSDLEWQTCLLLNHSDNAHWVQYKLDQRIDHFLIDEFQDTNPTQWQLILPLLQELAAGKQEKQRSAFIVGDAKQSIYGFRRADARLLTCATYWLEQNLNARTQPLDKSWRSAQAIIDCVNTVFTNKKISHRINDFHTHETHHPDISGQVEVLPLITNIEVKKEKSAPSELRNPLHTPRPDKSTSPQYHEACMIAERIETLINSKTEINQHKTPATITYNDVLILLRNRTHLYAYEQALKEHDIPFSSSSKTTLLDNIEIADMEALLTVLVTPYDNLALARVLRSPIFSVTDEDLIKLASLNEDNWMHALDKAVVHEPENSPLYRANYLINKWHKLANQLPVHDLMDRIYCDGNIPARYESAMPDSLKFTARINLTSFIELALEVDSGRYPSLPHFIGRLSEIKKGNESNNDNLTITADNNNYVRIMTIHGSKGLEAPVVFLADATSIPGDKDFYSTMIDWPTEQSAPDAFIIASKKDDLDTKSQKLINKLKRKEEYEDANLLYVALTRARQMLFISGNKESKSKNTWYDIIHESLSEIAPNDNETVLRLVSGKQPFAKGKTVKEETSTKSKTDPRLSHPMVLGGQGISELHPSETESSSNGLAVKSEYDARQRGEIIHRMLEILSSPENNKEQIPLQVANEFSTSEKSALFQQYWQEANVVFEMNKFHYLFNSSQYTKAWNEVPICYQHNNQNVYGIIDRIVMTENEIIIVDYKTHHYASKENINSLAEPYQTQLQLYSEGVKKLWPNKKVKSQLLFTACGETVDLNH